MHKIGLRMLVEYTEQEIRMRENPQVLFISTIYNQFPLIAAAMEAQTYQNWRLWMLHDGPVGDNVDMLRILNGINDSRIQFMQTTVRQQQYGHPMRKWALEQLKAGEYPDAKYVVITNSDNYFLPVFCQYMLNGFEGKKDCKAVYCDMLHNYFGNIQVRTKIKLANIDIAAVMFERNCVAEEGWNSMDHSSDWTLIDAIHTKHGHQSFVKVPGTLVVHN